MNKLQCLTIAAFLISYSFNSNCQAVLADTGFKRLLVDTLEIQAACDIAFQAQPSNPEKCFQLGNLIVKSSEKLGYPRGTAAGYARIALAYQAWDNYNSALSYFRKSLNLRLELNDKAGVTKSYVNLGNCFFRSTDYDSSILYCNLAYHLADSLNDDNQRSSALSLYASIYAEHDRNFEEAIKNQLAALKIQKRTSNKIGAASSYMKIAGYLQESKRPEEARIYCDSAFKIDSAINDSSGLSDCYMEYGNIAWREKKYDTSLIYYKKALEILRDAGDKRGQSQTLANMASAYHLWGKYQESLQTNLEALVLADETKTTALRIAIYDSLSVLLAEMKNYKSALEYSNNYKVLYDSVYNISKDSTIAKYQTLYGEQKNQNIIAQQKLLLAQKNAQSRLLIVTSILLLIMAIVVFFYFRQRALSIRKTATVQAEAQRQISVLERQHAIELERQRISRDMHDELGSGISMISMVSDLVKKENLSPKVLDEIEKISSASNEMVQQLREIVWTLNPENDHLKNLIIYLRQYALNFFNNTSVGCRVKTPDRISDTPVSGELRRALFLVVKEALTNLLRHANASQANILIGENDHQLEITISDNGTGISESRMNQFGNGLGNMEKRMEEVGGKFKVVSSQGTTVLLTISLNNIH